MDFQAFKVILDKHFDNTFSEIQLSRLNRYASLLAEKNKQINLISRKDVEHIFTHHILHALSICLFLKFKKNQNILDIGSGGGLPGIPLSIIFPDSHFTLVDSMRKKALVMEEFKNELGLNNITVFHNRVENLGIEHKFDSVVSRAVASLGELIYWSKKLLKKDTPFESSGFIFLKGGDLNDEISNAGVRFEKYDIIKKIPEVDYYENKYILHSPFS